MTECYNFQVHPCHNFQLDFYRRLWKAWVTKHPSVHHPIYPDDLAIFWIGWNLTTPGVEVVCVFFFLHPLPRKVSFFFPFLHPLDPFPTYPLPLSFSHSPFSPSLSCFLPLSNCFFLQLFLCFFLFVFVSFLVCFFFLFFPPLYVWEGGGTL